ncbi:hypothetical protein JTB14_019223 [Gonioctena quinquepunctata]|nr:hypothetical protein JTB14_019223 [Gonioctena quinquepunctata]
MCSLICLNRQPFKKKAKAGKKYGHLIKAHSAQRTKDATDCAAVEDNGASDLLQLVRRLSYTSTATSSARGRDDVKMGANVSRHSVKGLSGRRSQSSGSICNGSGGSSSGKSSRHPDGKICSSLPSYLDERGDEGACNNNHREKPLDEVDRIPPLGDGAPLHWKFSDTQTALCDQGYGSERSPEEEYPPPLPDHDHLQCHHHLEPHACYPFVTPGKSSNDF